MIKNYTLQEMSTGMKIKLGRIAQKKKQYVYASELGISREYLRLIENDEANNPSKELMVKIAKSLDYQVGELFFGEGKAERREQA